jgi:hypothetical protein
LKVFDPVPTAGSQVGHYRLLREIAKGPLGKLYELRAEDDTRALGGVARIVPLNAELPEVVQALSDAAWDSMEIRHELALCVADVVFGEGWVALVHDFSEGTLVRSLQKRTKERQSAFPANVALRVALDVLEGIEKSRVDCETAQVTWKPGGTSATSLYLCGDGRTRALDGQLMATLIRARQLSPVARATGYPAPELLELSQEPDERADVFAVGTLLWELLTGRELALESAIAQGQRPRPKLASISLSIPKGEKQISPQLTKTIVSAIELDVASRTGTLRELKAALLEEGEIASYAQVIDYVDGLLHRESTLFRLDLAPAPKLSDKGQSEHPRRGTKKPPPKPDQLMALARQAQAKQELPSEPKAVPVTATATRAQAKAAPAGSLQFKKPTTSQPAHSAAAKSPATSVANANLPSSPKTRAPDVTASVPLAPETNEAAAVVSVPADPAQSQEVSATAQLLAESVALAARESHAVEHPPSLLAVSATTTTTTVESSAQPKQTAKPAPELRRQIVVGLIGGTVALALVAIVLVLVRGSGSSESTIAPSSAAVASPPSSAQPPLAAPTPAPATVAATVAPAATASVAPAATASVVTPTSSSSPPAAPLTSSGKPTVDTRKAPIRNAAPKRRRQYVPTEL